ncbi:hemolysin [Sphingobacterium faecium NBRC 15299]|uniref:HlyD family secretion protein n=1 Tax=Sphingobacterium faecium TaxID=34087 RepID=UPI000D34A12C|nr:HlyD family efflux transporter periplasmic adaptor subunit [Sphingobacterium faecium]PTX09469.1 HlyD family secretion protein [Sphingobacterium faecium]GEM63908.1 hemolysin [Sphingobacterium faecium NBRC 15299]
MRLNLISKYGTYITCITLVVVGLFTWFIKYPETVTTRSKLTGTNAPKPLIAKQNLRLAHLFISDNQQVKQGDIIAVLESTADYNEILRLEQLLKNIEDNIQKGSLNNIKSDMQQSFQHLGELQGDYQSFVQAYIPFRDYVLGDYVSKRKQLLNKDLSIVNQSKSVLNDQKSLQKKDMDLTQTTVDKNKLLLDEKLISEEEYRNLNSQYINKQMNEPQLRSGFIGNEAQVNAINKELTELDNKISIEQSLFEQAVLHFKSKIDLWKQNFLLVANCTGKLVFSSFLQVNQNLESGKVIANIIPPKSDMYLETLIPQNNFGKVELGQKVILKFEAYPWQQFGTVTGKIDYISPVPTDSGFYLAKVILPNNLETNYKKNIPFVEGLIAHSEIITKDLRLAESLYYDLIKTIKK